MEYLHVSELVTGFTESVNPDIAVEYSNQVRGFSPQQLHHVITYTSNLLYANCGVPNDI
jgi:hypothetical protein